MNEAIDLFDAILKADSRIGLERRIANKREQIRSVTERRCGNCGAWMLPRCKFEKWEMPRTINDCACNDFALGGSSPMLKAEFEAELVELERG